MPTPTFPVLVDGTGAIVLSSPQGGFQIGGGIYLPYIDATFTTLQMNLSSDGGATWNIQDNANSPVSSNFGTAPIASASDGTSKIFVFYTGPIPLSNLACAIFNCLTNKWQSNTVSGNAGFASNFTAAGFRSTDGKVIVVGAVAAFNIAGLIRPGFCIFDPSALTFTGYTAYGSNVNDGFDWLPSSCTPGANGLMHLIMLTSDPLSINPLRTFQQQSLNSANGISAASQVDFISDAGSSVLPFLRCSCDGTTVSVFWLPTTLASTIRTYQGVSQATVVFGNRQNVTPLAQTVTRPNILRVPGTTYLFILQNNGVNAFINFTTDTGGGFGAVTQLFTGTGLTAHPAAANLQVFPLTTYAYGLMWSGSVFFAAQGGSGSLGGPGATGGKGAPSAAKLSGSGPGLSPSGIPFALALPPNILKSKQFSRNGFDLCLARNWLDIDRRDNYAFSCPKPAQCYPSDPPWIVMPKNGVKFKPVGTLAVAGNFNGLDIPVVQFKVDLGYDGVITDIVAQLSSIGATGFAEGSGDVTFRLQQNLRWSRDLGNVKVSLGSMLSPGYSGLNRIRLFSGQLITIYVNLLPAAAARINPAANVICSLNGYMYPRV